MTSESLAEAACRVGRRGGFARGAAFVFGGALILAPSLIAQTEGVRADLAAAEAERRVVVEERIVVGATFDMSGAYSVASRSFVKVQITPRLAAAGSGDPDSRPSVVSGFVLDADGTVVTVADSLEDYHAVVVERIDGVVQLARVVGVDEDHNLAVLKIDPDSRVAPTLGQEARLKPGSPIVSIGSPYDLGPSANVGHVAALDREIQDEGRTRSGLMQLTLPIHPGEQGGPVVNGRGHIVGMVMTRLDLGEEDSEPRAISFALPIDRVVEVSAKIRKRSSWAEDGDRAPFPFLGVRAIDIEDPALRAQAGLAEGEGCLIEVVFPETGASAAGLLPFDVLTQFDGLLIRGTMGLGAAIQGCRVDQTVLIRVLREGELIDLKVTLRGHR